MRTLTHSVCCGVLLAAALACSSGDSDTTASAPAASTSPLPRFSFYYQQLSSAKQLAALGKPDAVVLTRQKDEKASAGYIHQAGAKAYRYLQSYWSPAGYSYDGFEIDKNDKNLAYCKVKSTPLFGRKQGGHTWYYIDANERAFTNYWSRLLNNLKADGYDGVMLDRGMAALTGTSDELPGIWDRASSCTSQPVKKGATFADAYVHIMSMVHQAGLKLLVNYGISPFDPTLAMRPDPRDPACRARKFATCRKLGDALKYADHVLDEGATHVRDVDWTRDFAANYANEHDRRGAGGKVVTLITQGNLKGNASYANLLYAFSKIRLFNLPVSIFTGDDKCQGQPGLCNRLGAYPKLSGATFGTPVGAKPTSTKCVPKSKIHCVWVRTYSRGVVLTNVSNRTVTATADLAGTRCMRLTSLYSNKRTACVTRVTVTLPPWSGRPFVQ